MALCRGLSNKGNVSPRTLIRDPLATEETRELLREFLEECGLDSALDELTFWEICNSLIEKASNFSDGWLSRLRGAGYRRRDLTKDVLNAVRFAENQRVNLDYGELGRLESAARNSRVSDMADALKEAQQQVAVLLTPRIDAYRKHLRQQHNLA